MLLASGCGFLIAVLWMDLMFDVQVLSHRGARELPEEVLASIAGYYRRVTTTARPMTHAVGAAMAATVIGVVAWALRAPLGTAAVSLGLILGAVGLAVVRVFPNAVRLGTRADPPAVQSALARAICRDHLVCLAAIVALVGVRLWAAA